MKKKSSIDQITLAALIASETAQKEGIDNTPPITLQPNLNILSQGLNNVALMLGCQLNITSGYRCPQLNERVGGVANSQHVQGLAADFVAPTFGSPLDVAQAIAASSIMFDQLILEFGRWVHLSFTPNAQTPRREILTLCKGCGYREGLFECS